MEYCDGGSLRDLSHVKLKEKHISYFAQQVLAGLEYLHEKERMHRDLKSENVLVNMEGTVKLADLGLSTTASESENNKSRMAGSKYWCAPEMISSTGYGTKADIWSFGCILHELADGNPPYGDFMPLKALYYTAKYGAPPLKNPDKWSENFLDFMAKCLDINPVERASAFELLRHPFLKTTSTRSEVKKLLQESFLLRVAERLAF